MPAFYRLVFRKMCVFLSQVKNGKRNGEKKINNDREYGGRGGAVAAAIEIQDASRGPWRAVRGAGWKERASERGR